jgi:hypothetical protein
MDEVVLKIRPAAGGWWVDCDLPLQPTYFRSGARAEETAQVLALRLSDAGLDVRVLIRDRTDQLVATRRYFGA